MIFSRLALSIIISAAAAAAAGVYVACDGYTTDRRS